jgi:hypothetical protein
MKLDLELIRRMNHNASRGETYEASPEMYEAICTKLRAALWRLFRGNCCVAFDLGSRAESEWRHGMVGVSGMYGIGFFGWAWDKGHWQW